VWLDYRTKKIDKSLAHQNIEQDPYAKLLSRLSGLDQKPGKMLSGWQHWSKHNFDQHKDEFKEHFKLSGKTEKHHASDRQTFICDLFKNSLTKSKHTTIKRQVRNMLPRRKLSKRRKQHLHLRIRGTVNCTFRDSQTYYRLLTYLQSY
jgi:hypothetical protein